MFSNAYQNNQALEVFDAKVNVDKNVFYKQLFKIHPSSNHKQFDKEVKSYLYNILGQNTKMVMPADDSKGLALHQRYLVLHIFIPIGSPWTLEFTMNDLNGIKRRINITTSQGKQEIKYFSFRYPLQNLKKGVWLFLGIDVLSFMNVFKDQTFRSLDQITLGSCCRLRRIFTMKQFVQWEIPKNFWLSNEIPQEFQLIQYDQNQTKLQLELSKQLTEPKSPKNPKKISISPQNQGQNKSKHKDRITNSKSSIIEQPKQNQKKKYTQQILKSDIIQNAKNRLEYLQKQQQKIKNQSIQVSSSKILLKNQRNNPKNINPNLNVNRSKQIKNNLIPQSKKIHINKSIQLRHKENSSSQKIKIDNFQNSSLEIKSKIMPKNKKNKKPVISKAFKEDITIEMDEDQSSNFTQEHMRMHLPNKNPTTPYGFESKEEIIEEDQWSQQEHISRPISQAISNLTGNFPSTIITKQNNKEIILTKKSETQMELIYDQMVGCYYHPESNSYYQLKH